MFIRKLNTHIILSGRIEKKNISIYSFLCEMFRKGEFIQTAEEWFSKAEDGREIKCRQIWENFHSGWRKCRVTNHVDLSQKEMLPGMCGFQW